MPPPPLKNPTLSILIRDFEMETLGLQRGYIRIMDKKMATTIVYWVYIGDIGFRV